MTREEVLDAVYDEVTAKDTCVEDAVVSLLEEIVRLRERVRELEVASAAAVTVTEAMVEAAAKVGSDNGFDRLYDVPSMYWDAMHKVVTAALTAASEGASA